MIGSKKELIVKTADQLPEIEGARIIISQEGGPLPSGFFQVIARVRQKGWGISEEGIPNQLIMVKPMSSQKWWEKYYNRIYE